jgi:hypothetical protein
MEKSAEANGAVAGEAENLKVEVARVTAELNDLRAQNELLVGETVKFEEEYANRTMAECAAVITDVSRGFWRGQLLENREVATVVLKELMQGQAGGADAAGAARAPMHNRAVARPVVPAVGGAGGAGGETDERAVKIRNRAHEICKAERVPFVTAFRRAEMEVGGG